MANRQLGRMPASAARGTQKPSPPDRMREWILPDGVDATGFSSEIGTDMTRWRIQPASTSPLVGLSPNNRITGTSSRT